MVKVTKSFNKLLPRRYALRLGLRQGGDPSRIVAGGDQVAVKHLWLAGLRLQNAVFDRQLARELISAKGSGRLRLAEISQLKELLFEGGPEELFSAERRLIEKRGRSNTDSVLEKLHNLRVALGQAFVASSVAEVRDFTNSLPGDRLDPQLGIGFDGNIWGRDNRELDIKEILLTAKQLALTQDKTAPRFRKILNYIFHQLDLSNYSYQEATLLAKLIFQAAGLSACYVQGYNYAVNQITESRTDLQRLKGDFDEKSWLEIAIGGEAEVWVADLYQRRYFLRPRLNEIKTAAEGTRRPAFCEDGENIYVYQPGFNNRVFRPLSQTNFQAYEVVSEIKVIEAADAETSLAGLDPKIIFARTSRESRSLNEDSFLIASDGRRILQAVADGVSGHPQGEKASEIAVWAVLRAFADGASLLQSIQFAHFSVWANNVLNPPLSDYYSATTLVASLYDPRQHQVEIAGEGDSRAYRIRAGEVELLTLDDNTITRMIRAADGSPLGVPLRLGDDQIQVISVEGGVSREYYGYSYYDYVNGIVDPRLIGMERFLCYEPPLSQTPVGRFGAQPGDIFLLASDGLTLLTRDTLRYIVSQYAAGEAKLLVDALIDEVRRIAALNDTANDNITLTAQVIT